MISNCIGIALSCSAWFGKWIALLFRCWMVLYSHRSQRSLTACSLRVCFRV